jgi:hypothetical protein
MTEEDEGYLPEKPEGDLNRIPIGATLYQQYLSMQQEYAYALRIGGSYATYEYSEMRTMFSMAKAQSQYPEVLNDFMEKWNSLNNKYGSPGSRAWAFYLEEGEQRKDLIESMLYQMGITRMDSRPPAPEVNRYDFGFRYDGRKIIHSFWREREKENRNLNILMTGKVGGGKSYAGLSVGNYENRNFDIANFSYDIGSFIDRVQNQPKGTVIVLDEGGVSAGNKDSMSLASRSLSKTIQSTRYLQLISIFNVPNISFIDKSVRLLCDLVFEHTEDMLQGEFSVSVPELSEDGREIILKPLRYDSLTIKSVYFPLPPPYLIDAYEERRREHNKRQLSELKEKLSPSEEKEDGRGKNPNSRSNLRQFKKGDVE